MKNKIIEIANVLSNSDLKDISLLGGNAGFTLFELYFSKNQNNDKLKDVAINRIEKIFNEIENGNNIHFSYCGGLAGFGWFLEFINHYQPTKIKIVDF